MWMNESNDTPWSSEDTAFVKKFVTTKYDTPKTTETEQEWRNRMGKKYHLLMKRLHKYIIIRSQNLPHYTKNWLELCNLLDSIPDEQCGLTEGPYQANIKKGVTMIKGKLTIQ